MEQTELHLYNHYSETTVLGSILIEPELIKECTLKPEHFTPGKHFNLFFTMQDLDSKGVVIDFTGIASRVGDKLERLGGFTYLQELASSVPSTASFKDHCKMIVEAFQKRKAVEIANNMIQGVNEAEEAPTSVIQEAVTNLMEVEASGTDDDDGDIKLALVEVYDDIENADGRITGIATGYSEIDRLTGGYKGGQFIIVGARPSMGKTAYALNMSLNMSGGPGKPGDAVVNIHSMEMNKKENLKRLVATAGNINAQKMKTAQRDFTSDDWNKLTVAMGDVSNSDIQIFDRAGQTVNYIWSKTRKTKRKYPGRRIVVLIDYLQLIESGRRSDSRTAEIGEISRSLKNMARELDVVVIALSQLSRSVEQRQDKRPMLSDLRESGQIEQDADIVQFLYRDDYYHADSEAKNIIEVIMTKHRDGPVGTISLAFVKEYGKFVNLERRFDN
ncbi:putative helicase [Bacillus phage vB_BspS_SplendidRed]|uniref:DNA 5'-3' helicase n=1 Tax=Bacillus phage vB_BspS_SplendidRed TaxID=2591379 RepID=A0A5B9NKT6_9CAUD|nr:putative helicase [Bacillus phage vB_BspS_SplendidRed]QEG13495.1 putative helicase [Bacillus phage vB_BspS_SplendidRed]